MPELRKDYVTDTWVVFSTYRGHRPIETKAAPAPEDSSATCPFCPGHEHMTPPEILAYRDGGKPDTPGWWIRCIPNKFPALTVEGEVERRVNQVFHSVAGVGAHEVIVETPDHQATFATMEEEQLHEVVSAYRDRYVDLTGDRRFKYILIFKNHGVEAGASLYHPHSQLIATPIIPRRIMDELRAAQAFYEETGGSCLYDEILVEERKAGVRVVREADGFVALSPYAARYPFETWILPVDHEAHFEEMEDAQRRALARFLRGTFHELDGLLENPPFNYYIHTAPCDGKDYRYYHWHIEITPRLSKTAGFERGTGFYINPVPPEDAARLLREASS